MQYGIYVHVYSSLTKRLSVNYNYIRFLDFNLKYGSLTILEAHEGHITQHLK